MADINAIATALHGLVQAGMTRKELIAAVRQQYPDASKREIRHAAFHALIAGVDGDAERALRLQEFSVGARIR